MKKKQQAPTLFKSGARKNNDSSTRSPIKIVVYLMIISMIGMLWMLFRAIEEPTTITASTITTTNFNIRSDSNQKVIEEKNDLIPAVEASQHDLQNSSKHNPEAAGGVERKGPFATSLLNWPAPFEESDILRLSTDLKMSPNTVVTGYFRVASKFKPGKYDGWMKNFLSLQDNMVIFTQPEMVDQIKVLRQHALDRTVIIVMKIDDLPIGKVFSQEFWQDQLERDPEKGIHKSYQLFWIWLSKSWCVSEAIRLNFFESDLFVWSDIGCFRDGKYNTKMMIQHRNQVPPNEMIQMAHHKPNPPKEVLFNDKYKHKPNFYHSGSQFAAYKDTWAKFHKYFLETIDAFLDNNMIILEDQAVLQSVCLQHPEICVYVPFSEVKDNHYFGLRYILHNGGDYKLWRYTEKLS